MNGNMVDLEEVRKAILSIPGIDEAYVTFEQGSLSAVVQDIGSGRHSSASTMLKRELTRKIASYKIPRNISFE